MVKHVHNGHYRVSTDIFVQEQEIFICPKHIMQQKSSFFKQNTLQHNKASGVKNQSG